MTAENQKKSAKSEAGRTKVFSSSSPNPIDVHVGARVRERRKAQSLSQEDLGSALDLTFQQIQKYERGSNRISASKLYEIADTLKTPIAYFFEGFGDPNAVAGFTESTSEKAVHRFLESSEGIELAALFPRIKNLKQRKRVVELVRTLADDL